MLNPSVRAGAPLYVQVCEALEKRIQDGEFGPGDRLPGDLALSAEYGVSVITARAAMRVLMDKLLVVRRRGRGTFVRKDQGANPEWGLGSMFDLVLTGLKSKLVVLERGLCIPPEWAARKFNVSHSSKLYVVRAGRESEGQMFTASDIYYRPHVGKLIDKVNFKDSGSHSKLMITIFQEQTGIRPGETHQTVTAAIATTEDAKGLNVRVGDPLLVLERDYYDSEGRIIQAGRSKYRVDNYRYRIGVSS